MKIFLFLLIIYPALCKSQVSNDSLKTIPELGWKKLHPGDITIPVSASDHDILMCLFPGIKKVQPDYDNTPFLLSKWKCETCEKIHANYPYTPYGQNSSIIVPFKNFTTSIYLYDTVITVAEKKELYYFFYLTWNEGAEFVLHDQGMPVGIAHFVEEQENWRLKNFSLAVGTYGSYSSPPKPRLFTAPGLKPFICFSQWEGIHEGPYQIYNQFLIPDEGSFKKIGTEVYSWNQFPCREFDDTLAAVSGTNNADYPDFRFSFYGYFDSMPADTGATEFFEEVKTYYTKGFPPGLIKEMNKAWKEDYDFKFEVWKILRYKKGKLREVDKGYSTTRINN